MPVLTFGRYLLELALMEYQLNVETSESQLATAAIIYTLAVMKVISNCSLLHELTYIFLSSSVVLNKW